MSTTQLTVAAACIISAFLVVKFLQIGSRPKDFPPGPPTTPFLGNAHQFPTKFAHYQLTEFSRQYGDIYSLMLPTGSIHVISSFAAIKEIIDKQSSNTSDRPPSYEGLAVNQGNHMAQTSTSNPQWSVQRKATMSFLTVKKCNEHRAIQQAEAVQFMYDVMTSPHKFDEHSKRYPFSIICSIVYGIRAPRFISKVCKDFYDVVAAWSYLMEPGRFPITLLYHFFPALAYLPASWKTEAAAVRKPQRELYFGLYERVKERCTRGDMVGSFLEGLIMNPKSFPMTSEATGYLGGGLLEGGADTTSGYLRTLHLAMTLNPDVQRKAQEEIDRVIGLERMPTFEDLDKLPYIQAVIKETLRWRPGLPLGLPHYTTEECSYRGYRIPKGSMILINNFALNTDPTVYDRPDQYWPERYILSEYGTKSGFDDKDARHTIPFGGGRRICPGMILANNSLALTTMMLLWSFDFQQAVDHVTQKPIPIDITNFSPGLTTAPLPFRCKISPRSEQKAAFIEQTLAACTDVFQRFETELSIEDAHYVKQTRARLNQ